MPAHPKANRVDQRPSRRRYLPVAHASSYPKPPSSLSSIGRAIWANVWQLGNGAYAPTDTFVIERYASLQARRLELLDLLAAEGPTIIGARGQAAMHPAARLLMDAEQKLTGLEDRLGLNPEARVRLGVATVDARSKLDAFLDDDDT